MVASIRAHLLLALAGTLVYSVAHPAVLERENAAIALPKKRNDPEPAPTSVAPSAAAAPPVQNPDPTPALPGESSATYIAPIGRPTGGLLYGEGGVPSPDDIQPEIPDIYSAAVMGALANLNPAWITSKIHTFSTTTSVGGANVTLHGTRDKVTQTQEVGLAITQVFEFFKDGTNWWPALLLGSLRYQQGGGKPIPLDPKTHRFGTETASDRLSHLTGFLAVDEGDLTLDQAWTLLQKSNEKTPIVLPTKDSTTKIARKYCYIVTGTKPDRQTITLRDPLDGHTQDYLLGDIFADIGYISHLTNWDVWTG